ncbi:uncharacterized protein LOC144459772 isoform X2 [Epinephelus lanceolatus]
MKCTLITALIICSLGWISVSAADSQTVEVQSGKEVTLTCSKKSDSPTFWFRVVNRTKASWISAMSSSNGKPFYCDGFNTGKFMMSSNSFGIFLRIEEVQFSDSGLYFCGYFIDRLPFLSWRHLNVEGSDEPHDDVDTKSEKSDDVTKLMSVILGVLTAVLLTVIIGLVVTIRKLQKAASEEQNPPQRENPGSDDLNYAAVTFCQKGKRREVEQNVVYSSTR